MTNLEFQGLEAIIKELKEENAELIDRCNILGNQIVEMKEMYDILLVEIKILKEGGNL